MLNTSKHAEFLEFHQVRRFSSCKIYALTPSSLAITVYRQQVRALNLAFSLCTEFENSSKAKKIAIIGGGFAGITLAAGLLSKGFEVHLFEQRGELCHLQSGCETRWLHPTIYEWPSVNSDLADARLPLLNWSAGTAGDVARVVIDQFERIANRATGTYHEYLRSSARIIDNTVEWDNASPKYMRNGHLGRGGRAKFDIVVLAVGFGVERGVTDTATTSYWRNDRFGQSQPGVRSERQEVVYVSGLGDGALIDLVRVCLRGFKHDRLIDDLFVGLHFLIKKLSEIRDNHLNELRSLGGASIADELNQLRDAPEDSFLGQEFSVLQDRLKRRLRSDTRVILNGPASSFSRTLNIHKRSFLNVVLAYVLYEAGAFSYIGGNCDYDAKTRTADIAGYGKLRSDEGIIRHGTERTQVLRSAGLSDDEIADLFARQPMDDPRRHSDRLWEPGWWSLPAPYVQGDAWWLERVPRAELVLGTLVLGPLLNHLAAQPSLTGCRFRVTLHRALQYTSRGNLQCYQQIAPYFGTTTRDRLAGVPGRVFLTEPATGKAGSIAVAITTGAAIFAQLPHNSTDADKQKWSKLWEALVPTTPSDDGILRFRTMNPGVVTTVAAIPVIALFDHRRYAVRYILYLDIENSNGNSSPDRGELLALLWREAAGIANSIEELGMLTANDEPLLATKNAARNTAMISVPGPEKWGEAVKLGNFDWLRAEYDTFVHVEYPNPNMRIVPNVDVLEFRPPV